MSEVELTIIQVLQYFRFTKGTELYDWLEWILTNLKEQAEAYGSIFNFFDLRPIYKELAELNELTELSQRVKINKLLKQHVKQYGGEEAFITSFGKKAEKIEELQLYMVMLQKVFPEQQFTQNVYQIMENIGIRIYHRGLVEIIQACRMIHENPLLEKERDAHLIFEAIAKNSKIDSKTIESKIQAIVDEVVENEENKEYFQNVFGKQPDKRILPFIKGIKNAVEKELIQEEIIEEEIIAINKKILEGIYEYPKEEIINQAEDFFENVLKISSDDFNENYEAVKLSVVLMQINAKVVNELAMKGEKFVDEENVITKVEDIYPYVEKMFNIPENKSEQLIKDGVEQILDLIDGTPIYQQIFQNIKLSKKFVNEELLIEQFLLTVLWEIYLEGEQRVVSQILKKMGMAAGSDEYLYFTRCIFRVVNLIKKVGIKTVENLSKSKIKEIANRLIADTALQYRETEENVEEAMRKAVSKVLKNKVTKSEYKKYIGSVEKVNPIVFIFSIAKKVAQMPEAVQ